MKVNLLIMHYKEKYDGQYMPNVVLACDEFIMDENPSWWSENVAKEKAKVGNEAAAWAEIVVEVDSEAMLDALYPSRKTLAAPVVAATRHPQPGDWIRDIDAKPGELAHPDNAYGYVDSVRDGGYDVIWRHGSTPEFVHAHIVEAHIVEWVDEADVPASRKNKSA
jgi:hypothetical protein